MTVLIVFGVSVLSRYRRRIGSGGCMMRAVIFPNSSTPKGNQMKALLAKCAAIFALVLSLPELAPAQPTIKCKDSMLNGQYVFTASGFTRAPNSLPGTPWAPKAILEVLQFNGDGC